MMSNTSCALETVETVRPLAPYIGGKRNLAKRLVQRINAVPHTTYAEVFVGMGGVFFRRDQRPTAEVINDWSEDVATFFRVIQHHYVAFLDYMRHQVTSRANFEKLMALEPRSLTDLQRSARFLYLQRVAFGGKVNGRNFGVSPGRAASFDVTKLGPMIDAAHERLAGVVIERLPWSAFIARYDRPGTLFYLDPPYYGCETDYGADMFARDEFARMADQLRGIAGRFILSLNDHPDVREIFAGFDIEGVGVRYSVGGGKSAQQAREVIISN
jgi:DNA adenine methylase